MDCSTPGLPVPHHLPELAQVHGHCCLGISSSDALLSFCPLSFPASRTFPMSHLFASNDKNIGASASASVLPVNIQDWISLKIDWFDLLSVQGTFTCLLWHHNSGASILWQSAFVMVQLSQMYVTTGKTKAWTIWILSAE